MARRLSSPVWFILLLTLIVAVGVFLRTYNLALDPPSDVGEHSQGLVTDPAHLTSFAASAARTGEAEPYPYPKWRVFRINLVSAFAALTFRLGSVSQVTSNLAGVIPSMLGLILLIYGLSVIDDGRRQYMMILTAATLLAFNFMLVTYNRAPFMESGLILYLGLITAVFGRMGDSRTGAIVLGILCAASVITGKIFGLSIAAAIGLYYLMPMPSVAWGRALVFVSSSVVSAIMLGMLLFGGDLGAYAGYLREHIAGIHGESYIARDIRQLFARPLTYGTHTRMWIDAPFISLICGGGVVYLLNYFKYNWSDSKFIRFAIFVLLWTVALFVMLAFVNYRPLRYSILLYLPLALAGGLGAGLPGVIGARSPRWFRLLAAAGTGFIFWFAVYHILVDMIFADRIETLGWTMMAIAAGVAIVGTAAWQCFRAGAFLIRHHYVWRTLMIAFLCGGIVFQSYRFIQYAGSATYSIRSASHDLAEILGDDAVLTGPYAPVLTLENDLSHFIYAFGLERDDIDIFEAVPITHLAVDRAGFNAAIDDFPMLNNAISVTDYHIRGTSVLILRVNHLASNKTARAYERTLGELAIEKFIQGEAEIALMMINRFLGAHPGNRSGLLVKATILAKLGDVGRLQPVVKKLRDEFPSDSTVCHFIEHRLPGMGLQLDEK